MFSLQPPRHISTLHEAAVRGGTAIRPESDVERTYRCARISSHGEDEWDRGMGVGIVTKVLYVEHNDDNRYMLKTRLELLGDSRCSQRTTARRAASWPRYVILMDREMPVP